MSPRWTGMKLYSLAIFFVIGSQLSGATAQTKAEAGGAVTAQAQLKVSREIERELELYRQFAGMLRPVSWELTTSKQTVAGDWAIQGASSQEIILFSESGQLCSIRGTSWVSCNGTHITHNSSEGFPSITLPWDDSKWQVYKVTARHERTVELAPQLRLKARKETEQRTVASVVQLMLASTPGTKRDWATMAQSEGAEHGAYTVQLTVARSAMIDEQIGLSISAPTGVRALQPKHSDWQKHWNVASKVVIAMTPTDAAVVRVESTTPVATYCESPMLAGSCSPPTPPTCISEALFLAQSRNLSRPTPNAVHRHR